MNLGSWEKSQEGKGERSRKENASVRVAAWRAGPLSFDDQDRHRPWLEALDTMKKTRMDASCTSLHLASSHSILSLHSQTRPAEV